MRIAPPEQLPIVRFATAAFYIDLLDCFWPADRVVDDVREDTDA
jgi:hypothetical protein